MPAYSYQALDTQGRSHRGLIEAESARLARGLLRARNLVPLELKPAAQAPAGSGWNPTLWQRRVFGHTALLLFTQQLAALLGAGLPLERVLAVLADEAEQAAQRSLLFGLRAEVNAGSSLARALGQHPREFDTSSVAVVAAGEQGGQLGLVLQRLADDLQQRELLRQRVLAAALYPAIVTVFALLIVIFLMTYVVPQVAQAFAGGQRSLPTLTVLMLAASDLLRQWGWLLALLLAVAGIALAWARKQAPLRLRLDAAWLRLPLLGPLAQGYNAARFAATLAMLAGAGVPILRALHTAAETLNNQALRADALAALVLVREGAPLAYALAAKQRFPGLLPLFARLGEQTGQLPSMLQRAADQLGSEVQRRATRMATVLEPLLIIGMGLVVMLIVLAVMLPIIELNQLVQ
ncbi:type II secretion system F family protein [Serpentinimonas maccroryi]|uniref:type II secretion system F family protein n=1 Tax=Serpentinimonas maccroryi TaxID=1458426 RepID=UPI002034A484|nr:type II secretion system F family protein [Serpentinimonas maccroryi]MCM2478156.1 type II secretion system protein GspF [Serpentinimonas maccroryi]